MTSTKYSLLLFATTDLSASRITLSLLDLEETTVECVLTELRDTYELNLTDDSGLGPMQLNTKEYCKSAIFKESLLLLYNLSKLCDLFSFFSSKNHTILGHGNYLKLKHELRM
jgi:hypothetical protein